jgi:bacterial/archaeal transporter family protein
METWKIQALLAALFAGLTSVLAKGGMNTLGADLATAVRTCAVFVFIAINALLFAGPQPLAALRQAPARDLGLLVLSGVTAALSWIFYFRAVKAGTVSYVALVDKGSILVTLLLAFLLLKEPFTPRIACGAVLILAGVITLTSK